MPRQEEVVVRKMMIVQAVRVRFRTRPLFKWQMHKRS